MKKCKLKIMSLCLSIPLASTILVSTSAYAKTVSAPQTVNNYAAASSVNVVNNMNDFKSALANALSNHKEQVTLQINTSNYGQYKLEVINDILDENPNLCYGYRGASCSISVMGNKTTMNLKINYARSASELNAEKQAADKKADEIIAKVIKPGMSNFDKELALHDYVVNNSIYDTANMNSNLAEDHNAYGVLVRGTGVCDSYAKAMCLLLNKVGIETVMVTGNAGGPHAWNKVKLDGQWYNLDVTWDDPVMSDNTQVIRHTYFNVTDSMIRKDHVQDQKYAKYVANSTKYYYFNMNKGEIDSRGKNMKHVDGYTQAVNEAVKAAKSGQGFISLEIKDGAISNPSSYISKLMNDVCSKARKGVSVRYFDNKLDNSIIYVELTFR